ncbi:MAG: CopD family protein [Chloroflexota bacterium]|nr:CopD family protein [Anaerolineales bacterium]
MLTSPPAWVLALTYWLHLLATVTWVGSLAGISFLVLPAMQRSLNSETQLIFLEALQKRLEPIAWFSMSLLVLTGLLQMSVNPHYDGFISVSTQWSLAILIKHLLGIVMVVVSAIQTWEVIPAIRRAILKSKKTANAEELNALRGREVLLLRMNFGLSILILLATAFARAS